MKENIYFAHGNGFPSPCYRQLLNTLGTRYHCDYIERIGHNERFPVTENWHYLVAELIADIEKKHTEPVIGVGHSLGGVLSLLAAIERPSLFKAIVMLDSPLLGRFKSVMVRFAKSIGLIERLTPAAKVKSRRQHWKTRDELYAYLKKRPLFHTFSEACLNDYINYGFKKSEDGYSLYFDRSIEYWIFRTLPHHLPQNEGKLLVPAALIYGDHSKVVGETNVRYMQNKYHVLCYPIKGGHMFPMENPEKVGQKIFSVLEDLVV